MIDSTEICVSVVTLHINDNTNFLENIKQGFKRIIPWNKFRYEIATQSKNNNLDYLINPTLDILIDCLHFHSKMVTIILREILLKSFT